MFKFGEGVFGDEIKDTEIFQNEIPVFDTDISVEDATAFWNKQFESVPDFSLKDILDWNEDDFNFDFDITDMDKLLDEFDDYNWEELSQDEKIELVDELVARIAEKLGLENIPEVIYYYDDPNNCGYYYSGMNLLGINACELDNPKELVNTVAHELRHAYQEQRALKPETEMDYKYLANLSNYISPLFTETGECILFADYQDQLVEAEARAFADFFSREGMAS